MKNFKTPKTEKISLTRISLRLALLILCNCLFMNTECLAQVVDWRSITWNENEYGNTTNTVSQQQSDYDWWYDHCTGYDATGTHIGYIAAGVGKYRSAERSGATTPLV